MTPLTRLLIIIDRLVVKTTPGPRQEYALILALIAIVAIVALLFLGSQISDKLSIIVRRFRGITVGANPGTRHHRTTVRRAASLPGAALVGRAAPRRNLVGSLHRAFVPFSSLWSYLLV